MTSLQPFKLFGHGLSYDGTIAPSLVWSRPEPPTLARASAGRTHAAGPDRQCAQRDRIRRLPLVANVVWSPMVANSRKHWLVTALIAVVPFLFVLVPLADAAACGSELSPPHATASFDTPSSPTDKAPTGHGLCVHGHCHHGGVAIPQPLSPDLGRTAVGAPERPLGAAPLASHAPGGLKRPPKG